MKRTILAACGLAILLAVLAPSVASAQYVSTPGQGPSVGTTDPGTPTEDPPAEVKGQQFNRPETVEGISSDSSGFKLLWLWLLLAIALGLLFLFFWHRRRDQDEYDEFSGAQPA